MNILITGATGFIGMNLLEVFKNNPKYKNDEIVLLTSREVSGYKCVMHNNYSFNKEDFYKKGINKINTIIHLGAFTPKDSKETNKIKYSISNIVNTEYLCNNIPSIPQRVIYTSTIDVYGNNDRVNTEDEPVVPDSLYGQSKLFVEKILEVWARKNKIVLQVLRIGHIYGEREEAYKKIIPETIKSILENTFPMIYTDGKEKRSFLYVKDCCDLIIKSMELEDYKGPINIVTNKTTTILELVNLIIEVSKKNIKPIVENKNIKTKDYIFNNDKMVKYLGEESTSLREGIEKEYKYFKKIRPRI